jgi:hypothetical protein
MAFHNSIIYKLHCNITNEDYYGSTTNYKHRISIHKCSTEKQLSKRQCSSRQIIERGNYTFSIVEECNFETREELQQRERYYYENFPCINQVIPYKSREELLQDKRDRSKTDVEKQENAIYRENHRQELKEKERARYHSKKDEINEKRKQRYVCVCGIENSIGNKYQHEKSHRHKKFIEQTSS